MSVQKSMLIDGSDGYGEQFCVQHSLEVYSVFYYHYRACKKADIKSYMNEKAKMEARLPLAIRYMHNII